jgi:putative lipoic acid-binding regulatory protein
LIGNNKDLCIINKPSPGVQGLSGSNNLPNKRTKMIESGTTKKEILYPAEIIFKAVFRNLPYTMDTIKNIVHENAANGSVTSKESSGGKFISYTITATFHSEDNLNASCTKIAMIEGFMSMF